MLLDIGEIQKNQISTHPDKNTLLFVLGVNPESIKISLSKGSQEIGESELFVLSTDGFWDLVSSEEIVSTSDIVSTEKKALYLEALIRGRLVDESDNYTFLLIDVNAKKQAAGAGG